MNGILLAVAFFHAGVILAQEVQPAVWPAPRQLPLAKFDQLGLRVISGKHVTLVTDVASSAWLDELPLVAQQAMAPLADYFGVDSSRWEAWRVVAFVIEDRQKFAAVDLLPPRPHDEFPHALSMGYELWVNHQPSAYYTRALFLHELTHSFCSTLLGGCGPGWYMEAVAELMGAHRWSAEQQKLELAILPADRKATPYWGRIPLVREAAGPLSIDAVMKINNDRPLEVDQYAAVWSLAKFMDAHPRYQERYRKLPRIVLKQDFNDRFRRAFSRDWEALRAEFQLFTRTLEYGHDIGREAIHFRRGEPLGDESRQVAVRADRGWQPSGAAVLAGEVYRYQARGRFVIAREPDGTPWPCEANGVTITYHGGRPLGQLLATVVKLDAPALGGGLLQPFPLDVEGQFTAPTTGTLYLRVNDSPSKLVENRGGLTVTLSN